MKKKLVILALMLCIQQGVGKIVIGAAKFLDKVGRKLPQFGKITNHDADIFSTTFVYPVENVEIIKPFLPDAVKKLLHKHAYSNIHYYIRVSTSLNKQYNKNQKYESINMPWSVLFHGWANHGPIMKYKSVEWGLYDPLPHKKDITKHNFIGYENKKLDKHTQISKDTLHKEQILIEHQGPAEYSTQLPFNEKRSFFNFWTVGCIQDCSINRSAMIVIYDFILKEPTLETRTDKTSRGVFYQDLILEDSLNYQLNEVYNRLLDYVSALKSASFKPNKPFSKDLAASLKKIHSNNYHVEDKATLENCALTLNTIYNMVQLNPISATDIQKLAESYAEELHLGKSEDALKKTIKNGSAHATAEQQERILNLARKIHATHLHNVSNHINNLEKNSAYKDLQIKKHGDACESIHHIYKVYARNLYERKQFKASDLDQSSQATAAFEGILADALRKMAEIAAQAEGHNEFIDACEKLNFRKDVIKDRTYQEHLFKHSKDFMLAEINDTYETIHYALDNETDSSNISVLKKLLKDTLRLKEKIEAINKLKEEERLIKLMNTRLPKIKARLLTIIPNQTIN